MNTFSQQTVNGVVYKVCDKTARRNVSGIDEQGDILYTDYHQSEYTTTGTYKNSDPVFEGVNFVKGKTYEFIVENDYTGSSNGYMYILNGDTQIKAEVISSDEDVHVCEWTAGSNYTGVDVEVGWDATGVSGRVTYYEKPVLKELAECLTEDNESWGE